MEGEDLFTACEPIVKDLYDSLKEKIVSFGPIKVEAKKTSLHILNRATFLGIHSRRHSLEINIVSDEPLRDGRVFKTEQVLKEPVSQPGPVDGQMSNRFRTH